MSDTLDKLKKLKKIFDTKSDAFKVYYLMAKVTKTINNLAIGALPNAPSGTPANGFASLTGGDLAAYNVLLAGYKYHMADLIADLFCNSTYLKANIEEYKASNWQRVSDEITARDGRVKNVEMIRNQLLIELSNDITEQIFYEAEYKRVYNKSIAVQDMLTMITQRISVLRKEIEMSKM